MRRVMLLPASAQHRNRVQQVQDLAYGPVAGEVCVVIPFAIGMVVMWTSLVPTLSLFL